MPESLRKAEENGFYMMNSLFCSDVLCQNMNFCFNLLFSNC